MTEREVVVKFRGDLTELQKTTKEAQGLVGEVGDELGDLDSGGIENISNAFGGMSGKAGKALGVIKNFGLAAIGVEALGGAVGQVVSQLDKMAESSLAAQRAGANLQVSLGGASEAFKGQIADTDLAVLANKAYKLSVIENGEELAGLAAGVQAISEDLGEDSSRLFDNAVTAIGRGSALILDNLGIILNQAKAEEIYADSLGKTVAQLSAYEKQQAFAKAATIEITKAGKEARVSVDGHAQSWVKLKTDIENAQAVIGGFRGDIGSFREDLRGLDVSVLKELSAGGSGTNVVRKEQSRLSASTKRLEAEAAATEEQAKQLRLQASTVERMAVQAELAGRIGEAEELRGNAAGIAAEASAAQAEATEQHGKAAAERAEAQKFELDEWIEGLEGAAEIEGKWSDSAENRIKVGTTLRREALSALKKAEQDAAKAERAAADAEQAAVIGLLSSEAAQLDHQAALAQARGDSEESIVGLQIQSLALREQAADAAHDEAEALSLQNESELLQVQFQNKSRGRGGGVTNAQKTQAAMESLTQEMSDQLELAQLRADINGTGDAGRLEVARAIRDISLQELETETAVLEVTRAKNRLETVKIENRQAEIGREREIIDLTEILAARQQEREAIAGALELGVEKERAASNEAARVIDITEARIKLGMVEDGERAKFAANEEARRGRTPLDDVNGNAAHEQRIQLLDLEAQRTQELFDLRQLELEARPVEGEIERIQLLDERAQLAHERELERMREESGLARELDGEAERLAEAEQKRKKHNLDTTKKISQISNGLLAKGQQFSSLILDATIQDEEKRAKAEMTSQGIAAGATAALEGVNAAAAFASFNYVQGIAHTAAAGFAAATSIALLSGRLPSGASGGSIGAAAGGGGAASQQRQTSAAATVPDSVPAADREASSIGGGGPNAQGGVVINIEGDILGTLDADAAERISVGVKNAIKGDENAA